MPFLASSMQIRRSWSAISRSWMHLKREKSAVLKLMMGNQGHQHGQREQKLCLPNVFWGNFWLNKSESCRLCSDTGLNDCASEQTKSHSFAPDFASKEKIGKLKAHDGQSGPSTGAARAKDLPSKRLLRRFLLKQIGNLQAKFRTVPAWFAFCWAYSPVKNEQIRLILINNRVLSWLMTT